MRLKRFSAWAAAGLVAVALLLVALLWFADLGVLKPQIERFVSEATGREFRIDGHLSIDLARHSVIVAEGIRLGNATWADEPEMISVGRIEARVDLWTVFSGPVTFELIDIENVRVHLARAEGQDPNWQLQAPAGNPKKAPEETRTPAVTGMRIRHANARNIELRYESVHRDGPLELKVESLDQHLREDGFLDFGFDATLNGRSISLDGESGTWEALLSGRDIRFDITAALDTLQVSMSGRVDDLADLRRPEIEFTATAPDIDDVTRMLAIGDEGEGDITLNGKVGPGDDGLVHFAVNGNIGLTSIESQGAVTNLRDYRTVDLNLRASAPDLGRALRIAGIHNVRDAPLEIVIDAERRGALLEIRKAEGTFAGTRFTASGRLPRFPGVDEGNAELHVTGEALERLLSAAGLPAVASGPFDLSLGVASSGSARPQLTLNAHSPLGRAQVRGQVGSGPKFAGTDLEVSAEIGSVSKLMATYGLEAKMPDWPAGIDAALAVEEGAIRTTKPALIKLADNAVSMEASIPLTAGLQGGRADLEARGGSLATLVGGFADAAYVPNQPFEVDAAVLLDAGGLRIQKVAGSLGSASIEGDGLLAFTSSIHGSRFSASASGPAFEELENSFAGLRVRRGPFRLSGSIAFSADAIMLEQIDLERPGGRAKLDLEMGRSASGQWMTFNARASGGDIRDLFHGKGGFDLLALPFSLQVEGSRQGDRWSFLDAKAEVGDAVATADGVIDLRGSTSTARFNLQVAIPSLAGFGRFGERAFRDQALALDTEIRGGSGVLSAERLNLKIGESDLHGTLEVQAGDVPMVDLVVTSNSVVIAPFLEAPATPSEPVALQSDGRMIPDIAMPYDALATFNAAVDIDVGHFQHENLVLRNVSMDATVADGVLDVSNFSFDPVSGSARAQLRLDPAGGGTGYLRAVGRNIYFGTVGTDADARPHGDWDVNLEFTGMDLRSALSNTDGIVFVRRFGGRIDRGNRVLSMLYGDVLEEILNTVNPFRKTEPYTAIECIIVATEINSGKLESAPTSLFSSDKLLIVARVLADLGTEKIELGFRTEPKRRLSISAGEIINPYIAVVGTMAKPRLAVDQKGVLITGGAAVATGGLTILAQGVWNRLSRGNDPCGQAVQAGQERLGDRLPDLDVPQAAAPPASTK